MSQPAWRAPHSRAPEPLLPPVVSASLSRSESVADLSNLSWVNALLGWIWPKANTALTQFVHDDLTTKLREALPSPFKNAHFSRFTLGNNTPEFGPIEVVHHSDNHVEVDLDMRYFSDVDVLIDAGTGGITVGIKHISFVGRLCIVLNPVLARSPIVGAVKVFCPAVPLASMQFTGLAAVAHYPGIEEKFHRVVDEWMRSRMVLPNKRVWLLTDLEEEMDLLDIYSQQPLGVLRVRVLGGRNLAGVNWRALEVESFDSHPFCLLRLADGSVRTSTVPHTTSPTWPANEPSAYFEVHHRDQQLEIEVRGEDRGGLFAPRNFTGFLGSAALSVSEIVRRWPTLRGVTRWASVKLDTAQVSREMLHVNDPVNRGIASEIDVEVEWFDLTESIPSVAEQHALAAGGDAPVALLLIEIRKGIGFPPEDFDEKAGVRWRCRAEPSVPPAITKRGVLCDVQEALFPEVPMHARLFPVVDKLVDRGYCAADIAHIVGVSSPDVINYYLQVKKEYNDQRAAILQTRQQEDHRVSLQWQEVLSLFVYAPETTGLTLELLDGEDREVGRVGPLPLRSMLESGSCALHRAWRALELIEPSASGGLVSWLLPSRGPGPELQRFATVQLDVSARLRFLRVGRGLPHRGRRR